MKVKVRNLDHREYVEMFRDEEVRIPANGYVEMGRSEAIAFLGQVTSLNVDGSGRCIKPKKLKLEEDPEKHAEVRGQPFRPEFTAPDGKQFRSKAGFEAYMDTMTAEAKEVADAKPVRRRRAPSAPNPAAQPA